MVYMSLIYVFLLVGPALAKHLLWRIASIAFFHRRTKISGAQWKIENVPQVLAHRCAYLNGLICDRLAARLHSR